MIFLVTGIISSIAGAIFSIASPLFVPVFLGGIVFLYLAWTQSKPKAIIDVGIGKIVGNTKECKRAIKEIPVLIRDIKRKLE